MNNVLIFNDMFSTECINENHIKDDDITSMSLFDNEFLGDFLSNPEENEEETTFDNDSHHSSLVNNIPNQSLPRKSRKINRSQESIFKKNLKRRKHFFPRIIKRDIRRSFAGMLTNVYNSVDYDYILQFYRCFCHPSCELKKYSSDWTSQDIVKEFPTRRSLGNIWLYRNGIDSIANLTLHLSSMFPDQIFTVTANYILPDLINQTTLIISKIHILGTKISCDFLCPSCDRCHDHTWRCSDGSTEVIHSFPWNSQISIEGCSVIHLNSSNQIVCIEKFPLRLSCIPSSSTSSPALL